MVGTLRFAHPTRATRASSTNSFAMSTSPQFEVFWPRTPRQTGIKPLAGRLETLNGRTIAQVWDFLFKGDEVFAHLEEAIKAQFPTVKFVSWREFGSTHGGDEKENIAELARKFKELKVDRKSTRLNSSHSSVSRMPSSA